MEVHLLCGSIYYEVREQTKLIYMSSQNTSPRPQSSPQSSLLLGFSSQGQLSFISVHGAFSYMFLQHCVKPTSDLSIHFPSLAHSCELLEVRGHVVITLCSRMPSTRPGTQRSSVILCSTHLNAH